MLQGGLFAALTNYVQQCFETTLNQIKFGNHVLIFKKTKHLLGSIIINNNSEKIDTDILEVGLKELLEHLEMNCPEFEKEKYDSQKIETLVDQYITNLS